MSTLEYSTFFQNWNKVALHRFAFHTRYLERTAPVLVAMPKWDLASETMIKTIKGEVVCCPCKLQAAVVSAMVSNTCPASDHWIQRILDRPPPRSVVRFWKGIFHSKCPTEWKKVKHLALSCIACYSMYDGHYTLLIGGLVSPTFLDGTNHDQQYVCHCTKTQGDDVSDCNSSR